MNANEYIQAHYETMTDKEIGEVVGLSEQAVKDRRKRLKLNKGQQGIRKDAPSAELSKIAELLRKNNIPLEEIGQIDKIRISNYQMGYKDEDGEPGVKDLEAVSFVFQPVWKDGPKWPVVQQARPTTIKPCSVSNVKRDFKTAVVIPDCQIGYIRDLRTDELTPFHDEQAMRVALKLIRAQNPELIVIIGDFLDLPMFGKYVQEAGFALTAQASFNRAHKFLCEIKANAPRARIVLIEGNHDRRLQAAVVNNALAAFGLHRANQPEEWPVLSVPYLLRLKELGIDYIDGYPAGEFWINDRLVCIHGHKVNSSGSTAFRVVEDERVSVIFGHVHRLEERFKTVRVRGGCRINRAVSVGCLCRIDGVVPSAKGALDVFGRPVQSFENWQQGLALVHYQEGDAPFDITTVFIHEGSAIYAGEQYKA